MKSVIIGHFLIHAVHRYFRQEWIESFRVSGGRLRAEMVSKLSPHRFRSPCDVER